MPAIARTALGAVLALVLPGLAFAQPAALIIGNERYEDFRSVPGADDFGDLRDALPDAGFSSTAVTNADESAMRRALTRFSAEAEAGEGALVLLSGRFVHTATETYFLARDSEANSLSVLYRDALPLSVVTAILAETPGRAVLALGTAEPGTVRAAYVDAGPGDIALPSGVTLVTGRPDDVREALTALVEGDAVLSEDALAGFDVEGAGFLPWNGRLSFAELAAAPTPPRRDDGEVAYWEAVRGLDTIEGYENYLGRYPRGVNAAEARQRIIALRDAPRRAAEDAERALSLTRDQRRETQRALTILDFNPRGIDGIFGPGTRSAISAFQESQGFEVTGYLDREQLRRLDRMARDRAAELEEEARLRAELAEEADRDFWRQTGASGRESDLRRYLERYPEGIFAGDARRDLREIEEARRPNPSAIEDQTWQRVQDNGSAEAYREYLRRYPDGTYAEAARQEIDRLEDEGRRSADAETAARREQAMNLSSATRRTIEQRLADLDYGPGPVDGRFDDVTREALERYQRDRRLPATGYMNDPTMVRILADTVMSIFD